MWQAGSLILEWRSRYMIILGCSLAMSIERILFHGLMNGSVGPSRFLKECKLTDQPHVYGLTVADGARDMNPEERGWHVACPYSSNARNLRNAKAGLKPNGKHFVEDMSSQMDLCAHPYNMPIHGVTGRGTKHVNERLLPLSSLSKTALNADILIVPTEQWTDKVPAVPWNERTNNKLLWRGSNTGTHYSKTIPWRKSQRIRFVNETRPDAQGEIEFLPPPYHLRQQESLSEAMIQADKADVNERFFDIAFVGSPIRTYHNSQVFVASSTEVDVFHYRMR